MRKRVLVCPLDWGLGHATRCIPLIRALLAEDADVLIAADGGPLALLQEEFPQLEFIRLPGYTIRYSRRISMSLSMILQSPKILFNVFLENKRLRHLIRENKVDCVISDNRYGLWNRSIYTVFITHQLLIKCPRILKFLESFLYSINHFFIKKYDECWVPDSEGENNLSGELSHNVPLPANGKFIGLLSRFDAGNAKAVQKKYDLMAIISGPEPHRTSLFNNVIAQLKKTSLSSLVVSGEPDENYDVMINENIRLSSHLNSTEMKQAILESEMVICRAGYSSIMDLVALNKKAILIPTPGQTEQEYLAEYLMQKGLFYSVGQKEFKIEHGLRASDHLCNFHKINTKEKCGEAIKALLKKINTPY